MKKRILWASAVLIAGTAGVVFAQTAKLPKTAVIGNEYQAADGCQATGRDVQVGIPNAKYLDQSVEDPTWHIKGLTFRGTTKVGDSGVRNVSMASADVVKFQIFAGGGGTMECPWLLGCHCLGASGGSYGVEVTAHYVNKTLTFHVE